MDGRTDKIARRRRLIRALAGGAAFAALAAGASTTIAAPWARSYVVEWYELAFFYGGPGNGGGESVGTDCPGGINPANDYAKLLAQAGHTPDQIKHILDPNEDGQLRYKAFVNRGPKRENVFEHPEIVPDPGMIEVTGPTAYGFDLDGDEKTGFTSPEGVKGVDNAFYKASGCILRFRGPPRQAASFKYSNDGMHDGVYTMVIVVSGDQDPMNDPDARFGIYLSKDKVVKDAVDGLARDYSFRIDPDPAFQTTLKVRIKNGVIENTEPARIRMRDMWTPDFFPKQLELEKGRIRFSMTAEGGLTGLVGGYRDWREHYRGSSGNGGSTAGAIHERVGRMNLPAWWRSLQRNADGMPDPVTGKMMGISTTYRIDAIPAFVAAPQGGAPVRVATTYP
jgi:hypothetical protein